jgi:hypothetical protein
MPTPDNYISSRSPDGFISAREERASLAYQQAEDQLQTLRALYRSLAKLNFQWLDSERKALGLEWDAHQHEAAARRRQSRPGWTLADEIAETIEQCLEDFIERPDPADARERVLAEGRDHVRFDD